MPAVSTAMGVPPLGEGDAAVRNRVVLHLLARDALLVDQEKAAVGEQDGVADQLVRGVDLLVLAEQPGVVLLCGGRIDGVRVAEECHWLCPPVDVRMDRRMGRRKCPPMSW